MVDPFARVCDGGFDVVFLQVGKLTKDLLNREPVGE